jgi:hypothetical protein
MRRREFVTLLGGAVVWPLAARAQQSTMPVIGFLHSATVSGYAPMTAAFAKSLSEAGYVDNQNVSIATATSRSQIDAPGGAAVHTFGHGNSLTQGGGGSPLSEKAKWYQT